LIRVMYEHGVKSNLMEMIKLNQTKKLGDYINNYTFINSNRNENEDKFKYWKGYGNKNM